MIIKDLPITPKFRVGDKVKGKNILGKGKLPLIIIEDKGDGWFQCKVDGADVSMPYHESELEIRSI